MPKVRFLETRSPKDGSGVVYEAGEVYTLSDASCRHWEIRGVAERVTDRAKAAEPQQFSATGQPVSDEAVAAEAAAKAKADADAKVEQEAKAKAEADAATEARRKAAEDARAKAAAVPNQTTAKPAGR